MNPIPSRGEPAPGVSEKTTPRLKVRNATTVLAFLLLAGCDYPWDLGSWPDGGHGPGAGGGTAGTGDAVPGTGGVGGSGVGAVGGSGGHVGAGGSGSGSGSGIGGGLPFVNYVAPYVAYLGEQQGVVVRGTGFSGATSVMFGSQPAASMQVRSDTEILAVPPTMNTARRLPVTVGNTSGRSSAELVVRPHPTYSYAAITTNVGFQDRHILYDAERDAVFSYCSWFGNYSAPSPSTINRYAYDIASGTWNKTSTFVPSLWDIDMSPDGKYLIALASSRLWLLDPVALITLDYVDLTQPGQLGTAGQLGVANDGKILIRDLGVAYSLVTKTFTKAVFPGGIGIVFSSDGSHAVVGDANTSGTVPLSKYDATTGLITPSNAFEYFQLPSMDRTGAHYFAGGNLRDQDLVLIGGVPAFLGYMRPDAKRAYDIDSNGNNTHIHVFDLNGSGPTFPQLADIVVDALDSFWMRASLDSRYLFIPGPNKFIVVPLP